jgi:hypothetical protein
MMWAFLEWDRRRRKEIRRLQRAIHERDRSHAEREADLVHQVGYLTSRIVDLQRMNLELLRRHDTETKG